MAQDPLNVRGNPDFSGSCVKTFNSLSKPPIQQNQDFNLVISEISARIIKASSEDLDSAIQSSLQDFCQPLEIERGGLLSIANDSLIVRVSHAWYSKNIPQVSGEINLAELFPWSARQLVVLGKPVAIKRPEDFPPDAEVDRQSLILMGTKSSLTIPVFIGQRIHHLIVCQTLNNELDWSDEIISQLRLLGEIFVSALHRREAERLLLRTNERLDMAASSAQAGLWEFDSGSGMIWATNKTRELFGFDSEQEISLSNFLEKIHVEDRQRVKNKLDEGLRTGEEVRVEYRLLDSGGVTRWVISRGRAQTDSPTAFPRLLGVTLETTRRKEMEQELRDQLHEITRLREQLEQENAFLRNEVALCEERRHSLGPSRCMQTIMSQVEQVATTQSTVLIQGETGTGKELIAQTIHRLSDRGKRLMIKVNCAALPSALVESELFGREKGAFTGALSRQVGRFELANGSTLFLDEIAEMPLDTQAKLLRVLQEGEFERLGSPKSIKVDVRVIAASNRNLAEEVEKGNFRRDLYYRLNVFPIHVPPLRERTEEIPQLVWKFVNEFGEVMGKKIRRIACRDMEQLKAYSWPGNIRELRNAIEHSLILSTGETLELQHLPGFFSQTSAPTTLEEIERQHIQKTLKATNGKIKGNDGAAELLGVNPSTLYSRMRKLGIHPSKT